MKDTNPNILLLMTDQQRYDSLGCYGFPGGHTPNLDKLAADGVVFDNCYVNNPICTPSRASMFTGKHLPGHGVYRLHDLLPADQVLFTRLLQDRGYLTALFGKLHVSGAHYEAYHKHPHLGFDIYEWSGHPGKSLEAPYQGYGRWLREQGPTFYERLRAEGLHLRHFPREYHQTHWAAERTLDFLRQWDGSRPFFCMMSIIDPHNPYDRYPLELQGLLDPNKIPDPIYAPDEMEGKPAGMVREHEGSYLGSWHSYSLADLRRMRRGYHTAIALADMEMGRVLHALQERGVAENTLVMFVSDHGDMLGDHQLLAKGAFFYDPCVRVPLLMRWPARLPAGQRVGALVQPHDLAATMLAAAGWEPADLERHMPEARDVIPLATGQVERVHDVAICSYRGSGVKHRGGYFDPPIHATMIRDERYKLSLYHDLQGAGRYSQGLLYDMAQDRDELHDLWHDPAHQDVKVRLLQRLVDWVAGQELGLGSRGGEAPPGLPQL